jgi:hypothetical protein
MKEAAAEDVELNRDSSAHGLVQYRHVVIETQSTTGSRPVN